jgi:hypothetical protein
VNLFNSMDGILGLAAGQALVAAVVLAIFGLICFGAGLTLVAAALDGVAAGFLLLNWSESLLHGRRRQLSLWSCSRWALVARSAARRIASTRPAVLRAAMRDVD